MRTDFADPSAFDALLTLFVGYESPEVRAFHKAIEQFSADVPGLAGTLRAVIDEQVGVNAAFRSALDEFLELCKKAINPKVEMADVREMVIQHMLTEGIFMRVFDEAEFHRDNVIAHKLAEVAGTFYHGDAHCHQSTHDDPLPEMEEQDQRGNHCQDQRDASHRLDKGAMIRQNCMKTVSVE